VLRLILHTSDDATLIDEDALVARRVGERVVYVAILGEVRCTPDEEIGRGARLALHAPDRDRIIEVGASGHNREEIPVAVPSSVTTYAAPE
jgi:hypothetical protein